MTALDQLLTALDQLLSDYEHLAVEDDKQSQKRRMKLLAAVRKDLKVNRAKVTLAAAKEIAGMYRTSDKPPNLREVACAVDRNCFPGP